MATGIVLQQPAQLVVSPPSWESQLELVKKTVAPGLTSDEFAFFSYVAKTLRLDPLQRQIHAVKRKSKNPTTGQWEEKLTIQVGISGFRSIANRSGLYMPSEKDALVQGEATANLRVTMWVKKWSPNDKQWHEFPATAYYREFVQTFKADDGKHYPVSMWEKMPIGQLTKCAEALALRRGWPDDLGGVYIPEEMQQADSDPVYIVSDNRQKTQRELGTLKPSTEPNRGHGNEGLRQTTEDVICNECRVRNGHADKCPNNPAKKRTKKQAEPKAEEPTEKISSRERWLQSPGHKPEAHISFDDFVLLCKVQKDYGLSEEDLKAALLQEFEIQHRYLIRKEEFVMVLDYFDPKFRFHAPLKGSSPEDIQY